MAETMTPKHYIGRTCARRHSWPDLRATVCNCGEWVIDDDGISIVRNSPAVPSPAGEAPTRDYPDIAPVYAHTCHDGQECEACASDASSPSAAAPTQPPKDTQRLDWLDELGVEFIVLRDGAQIYVGPGWKIRGAIDAHHNEAIHDAL